MGAAHDCVDRRSVGWVKGILSEVFCRRSKADGRRQPWSHDSFPARLVAIVLAVAAAALVGCASATPGADPGTASRASVTAGPVKGTTTSPILELHGVCYGACSYAVPTGLPSVVVYDDGTVVLFTHTTGSGPNAVPSARVWTASRLTIDASELAAISDLARHAGLVDGGVHNNGTNRFFADGGGSIFIARLDSKVTTIEAPQLFGDDSNSDSERPAERARLLTLQNTLYGYEKDKRATALPIEAWALVARSSGAVTGGERPTPRPWTGAALDELPDALSGSARCQVFADGDLDSAIPAAPGYTSVAQAGRKWLVEVRPLLPHQHTCADVQAGLDDVHATELADLIRG